MAEAAASSSADPQAAPRPHGHGAAVAYETPLADVPVSPATLDLLETRRSLPLRALLEPGPTPQELDRMLAIAARVPDHGRLVPWRFIVMRGRRGRRPGRGSMRSMPRRIRASRRTRRACGGTI